MAALAIDRASAEFRMKAGEEIELEVELETAERGIRTAGVNAGSLRIK